MIAAKNDNETNSIFTLTRNCTSHGKLNEPSSSPPRVLRTVSERVAGLSASEAYDGLSSAGGVLVGRLLILDQLGFELLVGVGVSDLVGMALVAELLEDL